MFVLAFAFSASAKKKEKPQVLKTKMDSVSYALGVNIGDGLKNQLKDLPGEKPQVDLLLKGLEQAFKGTENLAIKPENAGLILDKHFSAEQEKETLKNKEVGEKFLEQNKKRPQVKTTESGVQYEIITQGTGEKPTAADKVKVHYRGTLVDGKEFDSSYSRNEPAVFGLSQVIKGWTEALQLMPVGSKWKIYLPYNLAYGERAAGADIKPYSALIFEVELIEIVK